MIGRTTSATRNSGKLGFIHVFTNGNFIQLSSNIALDTWDDFKNLNQGDLIEFEGEEFLTKTGEKTIRLYTLNILKKCELELPDKSHGINISISRQNKYLNLLSEIVSKDKKLDYRNTLILRHLILKEIRNFLNTNNYIEVTTPTLIENPFGSDAKPFETKDGYFLRIAPELELKKLIVGGFDKIYEIGKSFRNEGLSQKHNPEFTMIEIYTTNLNYEQGKHFTSTLLRTVIKNVLNETLVNNIDWSNWETINMDETFDEKNIVNPTYLENFTIEDSPLAKIIDNKPQRFELYCGGMEIANAYLEQDDWEIQEKVFEKQGVVDKDYINALKRGLPPTFGLGIGIDRLIMLLTGRNIKEVL